MQRYTVQAMSANKYINEDYQTAEAAQDRAVGLGSATVIRFYGHHNGPDRLPEVEWSSCGMWTYNSDRGWWRHGIYDGHGAPISKSKPTDDQ